MKRKTLTLCLSLLTCLSLIGVGFAAWVISSTNSVEETGNISVETVNDERFTVALAEGATISDIYYGWDSTLANKVQAENVWLDNNDKTTVRSNLTVKFNITVTAGTPLSANDETSWADAITLTPTLDVVTAEGSTAYKDAYEAGAITEKPSISVIFVEATTSVATYEVTISAAWGSKFNGTNPYVFYNDGTKTVSKLCGEAVNDIAADKATWGDHAAYYLGLIEAIADTADYKVTIAVAAK